MTSLDKNSDRISTFHAEGPVTCNNLCPKMCAEDPTPGMGESAMTKQSKKNNNDEAVLDLLFFVTRNNFLFFGLVCWSVQKKEKDCSRNSSN